MAGNGNAVDITAEHGVAIDNQRGVTYAETIPTALHLVLGMKSESHLSPGIHLTHVLRECKALLVRLAAERALAVNRHRHYCICRGSGGVLDIFTDEIEWVEHIPCACVVNLKMKMRRRACPSISANGYQLALGNGEISRTKLHICHILLVLILPFLHHCCYLRCESLQMAIDAGVAVGMSYIHGIAKARNAHRHPADISIGNGKDRLALHLLRLNVATGMEMIRTRLTKVSRQRQFMMNRRRETQQGTKQQ